MFHKNNLPLWIKPIIRFCYYQNERKKVFREIGIRFRQNKRIRKLYNPDTKNLIVFIVDGADWVTGTEIISGGILSIASIYEETKKLTHLHKSEVLMFTQANSHLLFKHTQFPNNINVFRFSQLFQHFKHIRHLLFHVPEYIVPTFNKHLIENKSNLIKIKNVHVNILNQNIRFMPDISEIQLLKTLVNAVSQTTAHEKYSTPEIEQKYGVPLHKLSVFASPERYHRIPFEQKEDLIAVSPDEHPLKEKILNSIKHQLPNFKIQIVKDLKYTDYLNLAAQCKFMITLGEGLDFYFIETVFSGGIACSIYNQEFFPEYFKNSPGVFEDEKSMFETIVPFIKTNNNSEPFHEINRTQYALVENVYKYREYIENIEHFYRVIYDTK